MIINTRMYCYIMNDILTSINVYAHLRHFKIQNSPGGFYRHLFLQTVLMVTFTVFTLTLFE